MIDQLLQSQTDTVLDCGHPKSNSNGISTGYATDKDGRTMCYDCCAANDKIWMDGGNHQVLYLDIMSKDLYETRFKITNWPGTLEIYPTRVARHKRRYSSSGFPIDRITVYFTWNKRHWSGTVGNFNTGSCFVARPLKEKK